MENPRKPSGGNHSERRRGQVVDLRTYQSRRGKAPKARSPRMKHPMKDNQNKWLRGLCFALLATTVITALLGLFPFSWSGQSSVWSLFLATIGLGCGLWLNVLRDRLASRMLLFQSGAFVSAYLCSLLHFFVV